MTQYAAYNPTTGAIIRVGDCQESDLYLQGPHILSSEADGDLHYVFEGALVALPTKPSRKHVWQGPETGWVDPRSLQEIKDYQWGIIKNDRDQLMAGTFEHSGHIFDVDSVNIAGASVDAREAIIAGETSWTQAWVLSNNTVITLTAAEMIALGRAAKTYISTLWGTSQYLRGLIEAATTVEEVEAITWP